MPWADTVFQDWDDCVWQNWADCEWDKFSIVHQDSKKGTRTIRKAGPEGLGNFRRPYLEGNPSYVEDNKEYPDVAVSNALSKVNRKPLPHMTFKQPYRYEGLQKMKYRNEPAFPHEEMRPPEETPAGIVAGGKEVEYEWRWVRYLDNTRWTPTTGQWFDNRWLVGAIGWTAYFSDEIWVQDGYPGTSWDGSNFLFAVSGSDERHRILAVAGGQTWDNDYRPSHVKVTYTYDNYLIGLYIKDGNGDIIAGSLVDNSYISAAELAITFGSHDINALYFNLGTPANSVTVSNIQFGSRSVDLSVLDIWAKDLRPLKMRLTFDNASADVSLKDKDGVNIYTNATYTSEQEVYLHFAGADIARLVVNGSGDLRDIEFYQQIEKGSYIASSQRPLQRERTIPARPSIPDPSPIQSSVRLPRSFHQRTTRSTKSR